MHMVDSASRGFLMIALRWKLTVVSGLVFFVVSSSARTLAQNRDGDDTPLEDKQAEKSPTAAELSAHETVASGLLRQFEGEGYEFLSAAGALALEQFRYL